MIEEILTRVDDQDEVLGPVPRSACHSDPRIIHRAAHVIVLNSRGEMLLQKRSMSKDTQPGKWDTSVGGHVGFGQSYEEAAVREAWEELGIEVGELHHLHDSRLRIARESENIRTFLWICDGPFRPDPGEVDEVRFWTRAEIEAALGTGVFTPNFEDEFRQFLHSEAAAQLR